MLWTGSHDVNDITPTQSLKIVTACIEAGNTVPVYCFSGTCSLAFSFAWQTGESSRLKQTRCNLVGCSLLTSMLIKIMDLSYLQQRLQFLVKATQGLSTV